MSNILLAAELVARSYHKDYLEAFRAASKVFRKDEVKPVRFEELASRIKALGNQCANEEEIAAGVLAIEQDLFQVTWNLWVIACEGNAKELESLLADYSKKVDRKRGKIRSASESDTADAWRVHCDACRYQVASIASQATETFNPTDWSGSLKCIREPAKNFVDAIDNMQRVMKDVEDENRKKKTFVAAIIGVVATLGFGTYNRMDPPTAPPQSQANTTKSVEAPPNPVAIPKPEPRKADEKSATEATKGIEKPKASIDKSAGGKNISPDKSK